MAKDPTHVARFRGLNNVSDPLRLGAEWLCRADNVDITDTGALVARTGWDLALAGEGTTGAYATIDESRMYRVDAGALQAIGPDLVPVIIATGLNAAPMHFTEVNGQVFFNNGVDRGIVTADNQVLPWAWPVPDAPALAAVTGNLAAGRYQVRCTFTLPDGRMTGPSESSEIVLAEGQGLQISGIPQLAGGRTNVYIASANSTVYGLASRRAPVAMVWNASPNELGLELQRPFCQPLPVGCDVVQVWRGRMFAAMHMPAQDQTAIWISQPLGFHLFNLEDSLILVPGKALMLAPHDAALIIGTDRAIHAYSPDGLAPLANYGVVPGWHWSLDDDRRVVFWTQRGVCAALPFVNLTEGQASVAPGVSAGGAVVRSGGQRRYLVALQQGGIAFNNRN